MASGAFIRDSLVPLTTFSLGGVKIGLIFDGGDGLVVKELWMNIPTNMDMMENTRSVFGPSWVTLHPKKYDFPL